MIYSKINLQVMCVRGFRVSVLVCKDYRLQDKYKNIKNSGFSFHIII